MQTSVLTACYYQISQSKLLTSLTDFSLLLNKTQKLRRKDRDQVQYSHFEGLTLVIRYYRLPLI